MSQHPAPTGPTGSGPERPTWRYALARSDDGAGGHHYDIREVYTAPDGALSWTAGPAGPSGDTVAEILTDLDRMTRAITDALLDLTLDPPALVDSPRDPR